MYKRPIQPVRQNAFTKVDYKEESRVVKILHTHDVPYIPNTSYSPIFQLETYIGALRYRGVPEDELDRIREKNKYTPPPPKKFRVKPKPIVYDLFVPPVKKVLKPVVKKM